MPASCWVLDLLVAIAGSLDLMDVSEHLVLPLAIGAIAGLASTERDGE